MYWYYEYTINCWDMQTYIKWYDNWRTTKEVTLKEQISMMRYGWPTRSGTQEPLPQHQTPLQQDVIPTLQMRLPFIAWHTPFYRCATPYWTKGIYTYPQSKRICLVMYNNIEANTHRWKWKFDIDIKIILESTGYRSEGDGIRKDKSINVWEELNLSLNMLQDTVAERIRCFGIVLFKNGGKQTC